MHYNEYAYLLHRARKAANDLEEVEDEREKKQRERLDQLSVALRRAERRDPQPPGI